MSVVLYAIGSVVIVSLMSLVAAIPLILHKKPSKDLLVFLLSVSVGVLLATVFIDFIPEAMHNSEEDGPIGMALILLSGFLVMFVIEKFVHLHHSHKCEEGDVGHEHAYHIAPINLIGDGVHNFIDGLVIAGSYMVNVGLGVAATISIIFHEIPQEIADFGVLLHSGMSKKKAVIFNLFSAATAIVGAIVGLVFANQIHGFNEFIIPFAAGNFLYIAATNLMPQLHRHCKMKDTFIHLFAICIGIGIVVLVTIYGPSHGH